MDNAKKLKDFRKRLETMRREDIINVAVDVYSLSLQKTKLIAMADVAMEKATDENR